MALFFVDDGMTLMLSLRETKESIQVLTNIAEECAMNINKAKSNISIFNQKEMILKDNSEVIQITDYICVLNGTDLYVELSAPAMGLNKGCTIAIAIYYLSGSAYFSTQRVRNWLPSAWHVCGCIHLCR